jgi:hypothetical protein
VDHSAVLCRSGTLRAGQDWFGLVEQDQGCAEVTESPDDQREAHSQASSKFGHGGLVCQIDPRSKLGRRYLQTSELPLGEAGNPMEAGTVRILDRSRLPPRCFLEYAARIGVDVIAQLHHAHLDESVH